MNAKRGGLFITLNILKFLTLICFISNPFHLFVVLAMCDRMISLSISFWALNMHKFQSKSKLPHKQTTIEVK